MFRRIRLVFSGLGFSIAALCSPAHAQSAEIGLVCAAPAAVLECGELATALERELGLRVRRSSEAIEPTLQVRGPSRSAVDVRLLRLTQASVGRTLDVSAANTPVVET